MPLPIAVLVALSLGAAFAWIARAEVAHHDGSVVTSRPFRIAVAYAALVYAPAIGYFTTFHGDWVYLYFVPWRRVPSAVDLALVLACAAAVPAGFALGAPLARGGRSGGMLAAVGVPAALAALIAAILQRRLSTSATYAQFQGDFGTQPIVQASLGRAVLVALAVSALAVAWCVRLLRPAQRSRR